jgi:hypothetical protein
LRGQLLGQVARGLVVTIISPVIRLLDEKEMRYFSKASSIAEDTHTTHRLWGV